MLEVIKTRETVGDASSGSAIASKAGGGDPNNEKR